MTVNKILKCSRAFPLGSIDDFYKVETFSGGELLIFVKIMQNVFDVLCYRSEKKYFCRYQFPRYVWYEEDIVEYLQKEL